MRVPPTAWQSSSTPQPDSNAPVRVLVVGDSGVGKSLLLNQLTSFLNRGRADPPVELLEPTIGYRVEAVAVKRHTTPSTNVQSGRLSSSGDAQLQLIDLIEVGGNKSLVMGATSRYQPIVGGSSSTVVDAVLFVYDEHTAKSMVSIASWYRDCENAGIVQGCKAIALVGTTTANQCKASPLLSSSNSNRFSSSAAPPASLLSIVRALYSDPHQAVASFSRSSVSFQGASPVASPTAVSLVTFALVQSVQALLTIEHAFLWACSCLLFGFGQTHVTIQLPHSPKEALALVKSHARCTSAIDGLQLGASAEEFQDSAMELIYFLSHL